MDVLGRNETLNLNMINLVKLQKMDDRIDRLKRIEREGPEALARVETELAQAEKTVEDSLTREKELNKRRRELEAQVEDTDAKIKSNQTRQLQAKTNEEYRALLKEADYLRKANSAHEDELLEILETLEGLTQENKRLKGWLEEQRRVAAERKAEIEARIKNSFEDRMNLEKEREGLTKDLPGQYLANYNRIYQRRNGRAVVGIADGVCQECHIQIPPQSFNELQRNEELMVCPNCNRIMYWVEHQDFADLLNS
ncbi:MAG: C4-type zinc ribbon domain-containing protein [Thermodesulfobacteriota bacterium]